MSIKLIKIILINFSKTLLNFKNYDTMNEKKNQQIKKAKLIKI